MKSVLAAAAMSLVISDFANAEETRGKAMMKIEPSAISEADIRSVSPALARFGREAITEDLWTRDALSPRDRSVVTVAMLIARNQPAELKHYIDVALDSGVTPAQFQVWSGRCQKSLTYCQRTLVLQLKQLHGRLQYPE